MSAEAFGDRSRDTRADGSRRLASRPTTEARRAPAGSARRSKSEVGCRCWTRRISLRDPPSRGDLEQAGAAGEAGVVVAQHRAAVGLIARHPPGRKPPTRRAARGSSRSLRSPPAPVTRAGRGRSARRRDSAPGHRPGAARSARARPASSAREGSARTDCDRVPSSRAHRGSRRGRRATRRSGLAPDVERAQRREQAADRPIDGRDLGIVPIAGRRSDWPAIPSRSAYAAWNRYGACGST